MPRFVVLEHDHPTLHWDFMLEAGTALRTWRLEHAPADGGTIVAAPLPDHRLAYLDYEGPVSGGRGSVTRWDAGTYEAAEEAEDRIVMRLESSRITGTATLQRSNDDAWSFQFCSV